MTDILDPTRLSKATAAKFYRWRWRNEGVFRISKPTIKKLKLSSRTVQLVHREAEASLLALQILLAHADLVLRPRQTAGEVVISPRKVLIEIRRELNGTTNRRDGSYRKRLESCRADSAARPVQRPAANGLGAPRTSLQNPPILHTLTDEQKVLLHKHLNAI